MLLIPVVSASTQGRGEGYFRREWKLAAERTHDMAAGIPFLVPVVIDDTAESEAMVPDEFMRVQWTRLQQGRITPQFAAQVKRLLEAPRGAAPVARTVGGALRPDTLGAPAESGHKAPPTAIRRAPHAAWAIAIVVVALVAFFGTRKSEPPPTLAKAVPAPLAPSSAPALGAKSIAVLPFTTAEKDTDFADGMQDDVITHLAKIRDLTVIARTSTLAYSDPAARNQKKIAADLGVATLLEGSVRRSGNQVRVTASLIDARTAASLWANSYDGDPTDPLALQASLAQAIAAALKATLTPDERTLIERRSTRSAEAHELYSRARVMADGYPALATRDQYERLIALNEQAIARDPDFALAYAQLV